MTTELAIANLALAHLGIGRPIGAMNEATQPAKVMTQFYAQVSAEVFRAFAWPFARRFAVLTPVAGPLPPASPDFAYSYRYPADALAVRDIIAGPRRPGAPISGGGQAFGTSPFRRPSSPHTPYSIGSDATGLLLYADVAPDATNGIPVLEYTVDVDEAFWPLDFAAAVSFLLAWYAAPTLTAGDPHKLGERARGAYEDQLRRSSATARNEQSDDPDPDSSFISARD